jgi:hypothetical protein
MMLLASSTATIGKYVLHYIDFKRENPWDEKSQYIFYIELAAGMSSFKNISMSLEI